MLETEMRNPNTTHIDKMDTALMLKTMNLENRRVTEAVDEVIQDIARAVDAVAKALTAGGRLIYVGAGTSGRLGVIDAAECPPTFGVRPEQVVALIAGGMEAMTRAAEWAEDEEAAGVRDLEPLGVNQNDVIVGISAAGGAAYVIGAMKKARSAGAVTVGLSCNPGSAVEAIADIPITPRTGAEALTGSTRLKAGSAQKIVLNLISTGAMIKTGKVYENLMINVKPVNQKLRKRSIGIIRQLTGVSEERAAEELKKANQNIRTAVEQIKGAKENAWNC